MKIVCLIPCRYHSTRFEGKPLAEIFGKPMVRHVYERVLRARGISMAAVVTDDERIVRAVRSFGGEVILTGGHHRSGTDRLAEAAEKLALEKEDIVVNVQGDQPTVHPRQVEEVVAPLVADPALPFSTLIYPIYREEEIFHPNIVKVVFDGRGNALYFSRAPIPFVRDRKRKGRYFKCALATRNRRPRGLSTRAASPGRGRPSPSRRPCHPTSPRRSGRSRPKPKGRFPQVRSLAPIRRTPSRQRSHLASGHRCGWRRPKPRRRSQLVRSPGQRRCIPSR